MNIDLKSLLEHTHTLNVLFVEDNCDVRNQLLKVLENFFNLIDVEYDGLDAINRLVKFKEENGKFYDLVITDLSMPRMDGLEFCKQMISLNPNQLVLVISAHTESEKLLQLIDLGIYKFLQKPVDYKDLLNNLYTISQKLKNIEPFNLYESKEIDKNYYDSLTSIYNRNYIENYLHEKCNQKNISLIFIDIDDFKLVNEKFSHRIGDELLIEFANLINLGLGKNSIFGRWGGEEFVIISMLDKSEIVQKIEKIKESINNHFFLENIKITASFGIAKLEENETISSLIQKSDYALYQAKKNGKNQIFFTE